MVGWLVYSVYSKLGIWARHIIALYPLAADNLRSLLLHPCGLPVVGPTGVFKESLLS